MKTSQYLFLAVRMNELIDQVLWIGALAVGGFCAATIFRDLFYQITTLAFACAITGIWGDAALELYRVNKQLSTYEKTRT